MIPTLISRGDPVQRALARAPRSGHRPGLPPRAGVGLKPQHVPDILDGQPDLGFFEVHAENYLSAMLADPLTGATVRAKQAQR